MKSSSEENFSIFNSFPNKGVGFGVIKKDGKREAFDRDKLYKGIVKSLEKRPFSSEEIENLVGDIESRIYRVAKDKDIKSLKIGEIIMDKLKKI